MDKNNYKVESKISLDVAYQEASATLRHYSIARITVLSIMMTICVAIIGLIFKEGSQTKNSDLRYYLFISEIVLFILGTYAGITFSTVVHEIRGLLKNMEIDGRSIRINLRIEHVFANRRFKLDVFDKIVIFLGLGANILLFWYVVKTV